MLFTVAVILASARALQLGGVRRLRGTLLLRLLRLGGGWFRGFVGVTDACAAHWIHHMGDRSAMSGETLANSRLARTNFA